MNGFIMDTTFDEKYCFIQFNYADELCKLNGYEFRSSYNVVAARVMGLSFPQWLLYCAERGAVISGKVGYAGAKWKIEDKAKANEVLREVNKQWNGLMRNYNFKEEN